MGSLTRNGAGVAEAVWNLALAQSRLVADPSVISLAGLEDGGPPFDLPVVSRGVRPSGLRPPAFAPGMRRTIESLLRPGGVVHSHGHWLHANWSAYAAARGRGAPLVISPHGMLGPGPLRRSPWRKRLVLGLFERRALDRAACIIAASAREMEELYALGVAVPIEQIPFGIWPDDYPMSAEMEEDHDWTAISLEIPRLRRGRYALFLGRLAAIKAPLDLLAAWGGLADLHDDFQLVFAGPDEGERPAMHRMITDSGLADSVFILPRIAGAPKAALLRNARLLVLCSLYESFGLVVPESLASGRPVLASSRTPWHLIESRPEGPCGWIYDPGASDEALAHALRRALTTPDARLDAMGRRGRMLVAERFAWPAIAGRTLQVYQRAVAS